MIDPLVDDWEAGDRLLDDQGGCAGVVRTCHWHQRSIADVVSRYHVDVWAKLHRDGGAPHASDHAVRDRDELFDGFRVLDVKRADEIALFNGTLVSFFFMTQYLQGVGGDNPLQAGRGPADRDGVDEPRFAPHRGPAWPDVSGQSAGEHKAE